MSEQSVTGMGIREQEIQQEPEVIANPVLANTKLIFSTPLKNEMRNGNLTRHMNAMLHQHSPQNTAIELNYVVNGEVTEDNTNSLDFIRKVVHIQRLARTIKEKQSKGTKLIQAEIDTTISAEPDMLLQNMLHLAVDRSDQVAVSGIDAMDNRIGNRRYLYGDISGIRTLGMDFAAKRLNNPDAILHLYDVDTVPENNHYTKDLLALYDTHPELTYIFTNLTHLPAGQHKDLVADSPAHTIQGHYNWTDGHGSPQITFRLRGAERLKAIDPGYWQVWEDRDTSYRLVGLFGDEQKDILKLADSVVLPRSLASDRTGGFTDGAARLEEIQEKGISDLKDLNYAVKDRENIFSEIQQLPPELQQKAQNDLERLREVQERKQKIQSRFNRSVVRTFLTAVDIGDIQLTDGRVILNEKHILTRPSGEATLIYVRANTDLLLSLTPEDMQLMRYYIDDQAAFPDTITELSPFQKAIREYIGEYDSKVYSVSDGSVIDQRSDNSRDKRSLYEPFMAEMLACASLEAIYFRENNFLERTKDRDRYNWDEHTTMSAVEYSTRSDWMDKQLPQPETTPPANLRSKLESFANRVGYPLGSLLERKFKK